MKAWILHFNLATLLSLFLLSCSTKHPVANRHIPPESDESPAYSISSLTDKRRIIVESALNSIGQSYQWGGATPESGFDCSGLVTYTHQQARIQLPRTAQYQYLNGRPVSLNQIQPADLVFFNNPKQSKIYHVGIYIGNRTFIHAPGEGRVVRKARLDNHYFKTRFIGSRTYIPLKG